MINIKASELIAKLESFIKEHGDIEVKGEEVHGVVGIELYTDGYNESFLMITER